MQINDCILAALAGPALALFYGGRPADYTSYTRFGLGWSIDPSGEIEERATDEYLSEYVNDQKRFLQVEGTNKCECDGIPTDSTTGIASATATITIENGFYKIVTTGNGFTTITGLTGNANAHTTSACVYTEVPLASADDLFMYLRADVADSVAFGDITSQECIVGSNIDPGGADRPLRFRHLYAGITYYVKLPQLTETAYKIPDIVSSKDGPVTVNKGTQSLLAEDIDTASYLFNGAQNDLIDCNAKFIPADDDFEIEIPYVGNSSGSNTIVVSQYEGGIDGRFLLFSNTTLLDGRARLLIGDTTAPVSIIGSTDINDGLEHKITVKRVGALFTLLVDDGIEGTDISSVSIYTGGNTIIGTSSFAPTADNYLWDVKFYDSLGNCIENYPMSEYREDTFVRGLCGNHGTASRAVNLLISENDEWGYPVNRKARTPWQYTTDDGVIKQKGLLDFFGGEASGTDLYDSFLNGTIFGGVTERSANEYTISSTGGISFRPLTIGVLYELNVSCSTTATECNVYNDEGAPVNLIGGNGVFRFTAVTEFIYFRSVGVGTSIFNWSLRQVSPAVGVIPFTAYIPHGFPPDQVTNGGYDTDTDWSKGTGWSISGGFATYSGTVNATLAQDGVTEENEYHVLQHVISASTFDGILKFDAATAASQAEIAMGVGTHNTLFKADGSVSGRLAMRVVNNTIGSISLDTVKSARAIVLLKNSDGTPYLYIDPFDGLIKGVDSDDNTCVSPSAVIEGVEIPKGWLAFNGPKNEMWISFEDSAGVITKGLVETFSGSFAPPGLRVSGVTHGTYQTIEALYFGNELFFNYVYDEILGEYVWDEILEEYSKEYL